MTQKTLINLSDFKKDVQSLFEEEIDDQSLLYFMRDISTINLETFPFEYVTETYSKSESAGYNIEFILKRKVDNILFKISICDSKKFNEDYLMEI